MMKRSTRVRWLAMPLCLALCLTAAAATPAQASLGYELNTLDPSLELSGDLPRGVAVDQTSQHIYVALATASQAALAPGQIEQFDSNGNATASSPFSAGGANDFFAGVAVNPVTHGIYAYQTVVPTPFGNVGSWKMNTFSSTGTPGASFGLTNTTFIAPQIAADSTGAVYFPSDAANTVQVYNSTGTLQTSISCTACPGGPFTSPAAVAIGPGDSVYVVDLSSDRVVKFNHSGSSYTFDSVVQSGKGAVAVAVDPTTGETFVGDLPGGSGFHVVAYDAAGVQLDDFGTGIVGTPPFGATGSGQIAVNASTHKVYVSDPSVNKVWVFDRVTIGPPSATTDAPSPVGQVEATLNATVNAEKHAVTECDFQYTDEADFLVNGYANATSVPCSSNPAGSLDTTVSATIGGLDPATAYRYRVLATNNGGSVEGDDEAFTTLAAAPPVVATDAASSLGETKATLVGRVNPEGGTVSDCHFEYGTGIAYGTSVPCIAFVGPVTTEVIQKRAIKDLMPGTTYHYRLVVTTNAGTINGDDAEFTTLSVAPPPPPPPPPPSGGGATPPVTQPPVVPPPSTPPPSAKPLKCKRGFVKKQVRGKAKCVKKKRRAKRR